jgi:hypothetical protein
MEPHVIYLKVENFEAERGSGYKKNTYRPGYLPTQIAVNQSLIHLLRLMIFSTTLSQFHILTKRRCLGVYELGNAYITARTKINA